MSVLCCWWYYLIVFFLVKSAAQFLESDTEPLQPIHDLTARDRREKDITKCMLRACLFFLQRGGQLSTNPSDTYAALQHCSKAVLKPYVLQTRAVQLVVLHTGAIKICSCMPTCP